MPSLLAVHRWKRGFLGLLWLVSAVSFAQGAAPSTHKRAAGYVPDAATAIKIAVAVWEPIYGHDVIAAEAPYSAKLRNGVWFVEGHLDDGVDGGVAEVEISKQSGQILRLTHGR